MDHFYIKYSIFITNNRDKYDSHFYDYYINLYFIIIIYYYSLLLYIYILLL